MRQRTLAMTTGFERYSKKTRRAAFLEEMEQVVPWSALSLLVGPHYPKAGNGRRPVGIDRMLRIYFLQQWFNLSDPAVEEALYDSPLMRQFAQIDLGNEPVPDETTVCKFCHLLEEHNLGGAMLETVNLHLESRGIKITTGTIVDATIIHSVVVTAANIADSAVLPDLLHGDETRVWGDQAYRGQPEAIHEVAPRAQDLTNKRYRYKDRVDEVEREKNRTKSRTRSRVEHVFAVIKLKFGYTKVRYRGIKKNANQVFTLCALSNLFLLRGRLLVTQGA